MQPLLVKKNIVEWASYFVSSKGNIHKFTFTDKQTATVLMCMFLAAKKCAWIERKERQVWFNVANFD